MDIYIPEQIQALETVHDFYKEIIKNSKELIDMAIKIIPFGTLTATDMINEDTIDRYMAINRLILSTLQLKKLDELKINEIGIVYPDTDILMISWISLGSALEATMQIFLTVFKSNYDDNPAQKWDEFELEKLNEELSIFILSLKEKNILSSKSVKSFKEEIKKIAKIRKSGLSISRITLSDLMQYFRKNVWNECQYFEVLEQIRDSRNIIHSFSDRRIGSWSDFEQALRVYIMCLLDLKGTMTYIEDLVDDIISDYRIDRDYYY